MLNKLKEMRESREEGFTLIELLVVIVIIGVLAAIALPIFLNQQKAAMDAATKTDMRTVVTAQATFLAQNTTEHTPIAAEDLNKLAPQLSLGTVLGTWTDSDGGYCIAGQNKSGETDGNVTEVAGKYFWYDSKLGGWQKHNTGTPLTGGTCDDTPRINQVWYYGPETPQGEGKSLGQYWVKRV